MTTIGVSVAVPDPWGAELQDYRIGLGDPHAAGIPTHITLLPPTEVDDERLPGILDHLAAAAAITPAFSVRLRGTGTFRPVSPVVFVNVVQGIWGCEMLASAVRTGPLAVDVEFPYHPHVTVAHHLEDGLLDRAFDEMASFDCRFDVTQFWIYEHRAAEGWVPAKDFPLAPADPGY